MVDCWREEHIEDSQFTWLRESPLKQERLDFFLIPGSLYSNINDSKIHPGYRTDHSLISLTLTLDKNGKVHSYWKFNNSLLTDKIFVDKIKLEKEIEVLKVSLY